MKQKVANSDFCCILILLQACWDGFFIPLARKSQRFASQRFATIHNDLQQITTICNESQRFAFAGLLHLLLVIQGFSRISGNLEQKNVLETIEHLIQFNKRNCYNKRKFFWSTLSLNKSQQREILHIVKIYIK